MRTQRNTAPGPWLNLSIAYFDLDDFKLFNDAHGHSAGDALLQEIVTAWQGAMRPTDLLARIGGDEFVVFFPDTDIGHCHAAVERLRTLVPHGQTCSAGIAAFHPGEAADAFVSRADQALYSAKEGGCNRTELADVRGSASPGASGEH